MTGDSLSLPPFKTIEAALRTTTERLARELHQPTNSAPAWNEFEWAVARAAATMQGISSLLADRLLWRGPADWQQFLREQQHHGLLRHERIGQLLARIDDRARAADLAVVALKGAALRTLNLYAPGERPMGDIDLLVARGGRAAALPVMTELGYHEGFASWRDTVFEPEHSPSPGGYGEHIDNPIKIEVHEHIAEYLPISVIDVTAQILPRSPRVGINAYPSRAALMLHLLLHAAGNMRAHALRMIQLRDIALLGERMSVAEWREMSDMAPPGADFWWTYPPAALTGRYFPAALPGEALLNLAARCPPLLRRAADRWLLTDVSWSDLRIHALPGAVWSRSPREVMRFAMSRLLPSHEAMAEVNHAVRTQPHLTDVPWYDRSQLHRIVRWLVSRPPRVQSLVSVRAALAAGKAAS